VTAEVSALTVPFFTQSATFSALWRRHIVEVPGNGERRPGRIAPEWEITAGGPERLAGPVGGTGIAGPGLDGLGRAGIGADDIGLDDTGRWR
jgi:hypothetical protein